MMKCFTRLASCRSPRAMPTSKPSSSKDESHRAQLHSSADSRLPNRHASHWKPSLSIIMEDRVDVVEDHNNNVDRKPEKKSFVACFSHLDHLMSREKSKRIIIFSAFTMF